MRVQIAEGSLRRIIASVVKHIAIDYGGSWHEIITKNVEIASDFW